MCNPMTMMVETKQVKNEIIDIILDAAWSGGLDLDRGTLDTEFQAIGMLVSGADGDVSAEEIELMNLLFDLSLTIDDVPELIEMLSGMHDSLIHDLQLPGWMVCKAMDEEANSYDATDAYIDTVDLIMQIFALIDGDEDANENQFIDDFLSRLKRDRL